MLLSLSIYQSIKKVAYADPIVTSSPVLPHILSHPLHLQVLGVMFYPQGPLRWCGVSVFVLCPHCRSRIRSRSVNLLIIASHRIASFRIASAVQHGASGEEAFSHPPRRQDEQARPNHQQGGMGMRNADRNGYFPLG